MKVFTFGEYADQRTVILFGAGLIGGALARRLSLLTASSTRDVKFDWRDHDAQKSTLEQLFQSPQMRSGTAGCASRVDIVWAAGRAAFGARQAEVDAEFDVFARSLEAIREYAPSSRFHLFSSAGGLFEGQRLVVANTPPRPIRPYGEAKLRQENLLLRSRADFSATVIYRPSTVYGFNAAHNRVGLVTALLRAAYHRQPALIYGRPDSLRDFISTEDIAHFVAGEILNPAERHEIHHLVSGVPSSIARIINEVETVTRLSVPRSYILGNDNSSDNTFHPSLAPKKLIKTALRVGIGAVARRLHHESIVSNNTANQA